MTGYVDDTAFRPVAGATVEVLDGPQAGASAITDASGEFSLNSAISGQTRFQAAKQGYQSSIQTIQSQPLTFFLATDRPSGTAATLTVDADPACTDLPSTVRHRTYAATVRGNPSSASPNTTFFVDLTGASLDRYFHFVFLRTNEDVVTFDMSDNGIEEEVADEAYLYVGGVASTRTEPGATTISAPLTTGMIDYCVVQSDPGSAYPCTDHAIVRAQCPSPKNRLTLTWQ